MSVLEYQVNAAAMDRARRLAAEAHANVTLARNRREAALWQQIADEWRERSITLARAERHRIADQAAAHLAQYLQVSEELVQRGRACVERQEALVARLMGAGLDLREAATVLSQFQARLTRQIAYRDRLRAAVAGSRKPDSLPS
jgi:hypothetical protein